LFRDKKGKKAIKIENAFLVAMCSKSKSDVERQGVVENDVKGKLIKIDKAVSVDASSS
jgi:uncharacterized protein YdeI (BOF family)